MQCAQGAKRPSRRRAAPTPSPRQRERAHRQNTPRAGYTPGRSRAPAMAPTLSCPRVGAPLEHPRALQRRFLPLQPPFRSGLSYSALGCARGALGAPRGGRAEEGTPRAAPPARGTSRPPPAHRVPGVPEPEAHQCSARRPRQGGLAEAPAPRQARLPPRLTPGQLTQDAVRGGKARAEAPARAHGPACRHRPPLWRVAWGAAWARHGPRWAFAWGLVRRRGSFSTGGPSDTLLSSHFLVIFRGIPLFGQEGRLCSGGL
jgi:hypothetical protein